MSDLYKTAFRGYLIDHHSPQPPTVDFTHLDPAEYERFYEEADISSLMVYTKDHWGYSYYDTKIGVKHPGLRIDYIGEISKILRRKGIEFNAYYCLEYDTLAPRKHPEWAIRDQYGGAVSLKGRMAKWGMPCYETGYREYVLGQLREIVSNYHPDSLFLDIFGKTLCYCDACRAKFRQKYGYELPEGQYLPEDEFAAFDFGECGRDVNAFLEDCAQEMLADIMDTVKTIDPEIQVTINFSALYPKKIRDMLDYQFTEPWAGNWLSAMYSRDTARGQYPQLGPGDVSEVYNFRPDNVYRLAAAQMAAGGCRSFFYSGSQHVDGTLEHTEARKVGAAYDLIREMEPFLTEREVVADVAIVQSDASSAARSGSQVVVNSIGRCKQNDLHREAVLGAMTLCDYAKLSWKVIPEQELDLKAARSFQLVVLAGTYHIGKELKRVLKEYIQAGGCVLADGACGLYEADGVHRSQFALSDLMGCDLDAEIDAYRAAEYGGYLKTDDSPVFDKVPDTMPPLGAVQFGVKITTGHGMGKLVHPCTQLTETSWVNWWCPPPAAAPSQYPVFVENEVGAGRMMYAAFELFRSTVKGLNLNRNLFLGLLERLVPRPSLALKTDTPEIISMVAYRQNERLLVHVLSNLAEKTNGDAPLIAAGRLLVSKQLLAIKRARTLDGQTLDICDRGTECEVTLPEVSVHQLIIME